MQNPHKITREEAIIIDQKWYFTGIPCVKGHVDKRYVGTKICYKCKVERNKKSKMNNPEVYKAIAKKAYDNTPKEVISARANNWKRKNPEKVKEIKKRNKNKHREKYNKAEALRIKEKRKNDPLWGLSKNLSKAIWECLKGRKGGRSWKILVSFTIEELKIHLEFLFDENMSWSNYGSYWHLDHIKPLSWFNLETEFDKAWDISNLQPMEGIANISKGNRFIG